MREPMAAMREIVFDCERQSGLARFWAGVLDGYDVRAYDSAEIERRPPAWSTNCT